MKKRAGKGHLRKPSRTSAPKRTGRAAAKSRPRPSRPTVKVAAKPDRSGKKPPVPNPPPILVPRPAPPLSGEALKQRQTYEEAIRLFHAQKFDRADALFQKVIDGPNRTLAHHAQVHSQICRKRVQPRAVELKTAEDHYNYAITMMNARRLKEAAEHLETALHMSPQVDYLHYALAATEALQGNPQAAYERLKRAIDLQPRNRILARGDADFAGILEYPPLAMLLHIERGWSPKPT